MNFIRTVVNIYFTSIIPFLANEPSSYDCNLGLLRVSVH